MRRKCPARVAWPRLWGSVLAAVIPALGAEHTFDGVYSGKRVLIEGSDPYCPAEDDISVIIHGEMLSFTDSALEKVSNRFSS